MIRLFIVLVIFLAAIGFMLKQIISFIISVGSSARGLSKDFLTLQREVAIYAQDLVPVDDNELELLSFQKSDEVYKKGFNPVTKGIINNIYHEKVVAYAYKKFYSTRRKAILYARTSEHEFHYKITDDKVDIFIDDANLGTLDNHGNLYRKRNKIASLSLGGTGLLQELKIGGKQVATLANPRQEDKNGLRAIPLVNENLPEEYQDIIWSMAIYNLVLAEA